MGKKGREGRGREGDAQQKTTEKNKRKRFVDDDARGEEEGEAEEEAYPPVMVEGFAAVEEQAL